VTLSWTVATALAGVWLLVVLFQLGDVLTVLLDSRTARDRDHVGRIARERLNELFWVIPIVTLAALGIGLGLDRAATILFDARDPALGSLFVLGIAVLVLGLGALVLAAVAVTDRASYSALRRELRELEGEKLPATRVTQLRSKLAATDARARARTRQTRVLLTPASIVRLASILFGIAVIVSTAIASGISPREEGATLITVAAVAPIVNVVFAGLGIRFAVDSNAAWLRVYARQRADIIRLLEAFERSSRKGVAGLGDRVARALQILREQQP
jgi:hypothetical protein